MSLCVSRRQKICYCYTTDLLRVALKNNGERRPSQWKELWWIFTLCENKSCLKENIYGLLASRNLKKKKKRKSSATRRSGEKTYVWTFGSGQSVKSIVLHVKVHQKPSPPKGHQIATWYQPFCHWPPHCWHNVLKKIVPIGYAWILQHGHSFSKIDLATGTVKALTYKQQRPRSNPQYGIIVQGD